MPVWNTFKEFFSESNKKYESINLKTDATQSPHNKPDLFTNTKFLLNTQDIRVIFDIGTNNGDFAMNYLDAFPESVLYCFEPNPKTFRTLETRFQNNSRVHLHNIAISDSNGTSPFYCNKENPTDSLLLPATEWMQWVDGKSDALLLRSKITVHTTNLDTFCSSNSISKIDILKIDAQGAECLILDGAKKLLSQHAIKIIIAELMFVPVYENQPFFFEICKSLASYGYSLVNLYNIRYDEDTSIQIKWGDGLFMYRGW